MIAAVVEKMLCGVCNDKHFFCDVSGATCVNYDCDVSTNLSKTVMICFHIVTSFLMTIYLFL